jgi:LysM repeat protein
VRRGDTLSAIARACGTTVSALAASNDLVDGNVIRVGQVLHVGGAAETEADTPYTLWIPIPSIGLDLILPAGLLDRY